MIIRRKRGYTLLFDDTPTARQRRRDNTLTFLFLGGLLLSIPIISFIMVVWEWTLTK